MPRSCSIFIQSERARRRSRLALHLAGQVDRAAHEQQMLGQRRLAGVRVRDDRERAPPRGGFRGRAIDDLLNVCHDSRSRNKARLVAD